MIEGVLMIVLAGVAIGFLFEWGWGIVDTFGSKRKIQRIIKT